MTEKIIGQYLLPFSVAVMTKLGYFGIVLLMAIESACIPLPSEIIMPLAGYLIYKGEFNLWWAATAGAIGCNLGSVLAYEIGYYGGRPLVLRYGRYLLLSQRDIDWADRFFDKFGNWAILIARMLPVVRTFIALPAGIARMPRVRFHVYTFIGSWPWCFLLGYVGMKMAENWQSIGKYFHEFDAVIGVIIVVFVGWFVRSHWKHRVRATTV
jgi:membrane protein DedA with SNARE-associated domain